MSDKIIKLPNRYGYNVYLEHYKDDQWIFNGDDNAFEYHRVIFDDTPSKPHAVDPSGGPYLSLGYVVGDKTVTSLSYDEGVGYIVELKPLHNEIH